MKKTAGLPGRKLTGSAGKPRQPIQAGRRKPGELKVYDSTAKPAGRRIGTGSQRPSRLVQKKRRRLLLVILITFLAATAMTAGSIWIIQAPFLHVTAISAEGTTNCGEEELVALSGLTPEDNILAVLFTRHAKARERLLSQYSFLREVKLRYGLDRSIRIIVTERVPVAMIVADTRQFLLDNAWILYEPPAAADGTGQQEETERLLCLAGLSFSGETLPEDLKRENTGRMDVFRRLSDEIAAVDNARGTTLGDAITGIDLTYPGQPKITVAERIILDLGGMEDLDLKIPLFMEAFQGNLASQQGTFTFTDSRTGHFIPE